MALWDDQPPSRMTSIQVSASAM